MVSPHLIFTNSKIINVSRCSPLWSRYTGNKPLFISCFDTLRTTRILTWLCYSDTLCERTGGSFGFPVHLPALTLTILWDVSGLDILINLFKHIFSGSSVIFSFSVPAIYEQSFMLMICGIFSLYISQHCIFQYLILTTIFRMFSAPSLDLIMTTHLSTPSLRSNQSFAFSKNTRLPHILDNNPKYWQPIKILALLYMWRDQTRP